MASGLRRQVPTPVQGASISTRSQAPARFCDGIERGAARRANLNVSHARALQTRKDRRQAAAVGIGGVDLAAVVHVAGHRQALAAASRAEVEDLFSRTSAGEARRELRAFVLDFHQSPDIGGFGGESRAAPGSRALSDPDSRRRIAAGDGREMAEFGENFRARRLQEIDAQVERRARGQRPALFDGMIAKGPREMQREPLREVATRSNRARRTGRRRRDFAARWCPKAWGRGQGR